MLKFSTGDDYFNAGSEAADWVAFRPVAMCNKNRLLRVLGSQRSLATALHTTTVTPTWANQPRGNKNGKEDSEEGQEDRSDEAADAC
jgi:hypothetical protein